MNKPKDFISQLTTYKQTIDDDIAAYATEVRALTRRQYGQVVAETEADVFLDILARGGKRIRGVLVIVGYEMCGGTDRKMIVQAARAIEMLHAYILIIDDIQDRASVRRGEPSAHELLTAYHKQHKLKGDSVHAGLSLALNAAIAGGHAAEIILANLPADPQLRLNVLSIVNRTMNITAHGQTLDIMNELVAEPSAQDIDRVLEWKTALYTIINPLHVGMVLAGADCRATDAVTPYALHAGKAFQLADDLLGVYGNEKATGKPAGDDIREGKGTLLTHFALEHANSVDKKTLRTGLGNPALTATQLTECRRILSDSGAKDYVAKMAAKEAQEALAALDECTGLWNEQGTAFLRSLVELLADRTS